MPQLSSHLIKHSKPQLTQDSEDELSTDEDSPASDGLDTGNLVEETRGEGRLKKTRGRRGLLQGIKDSPLDILFEVRRAFYRLAPLLRRLTLHPPDFRTPRATRHTPSLSHIQGHPPSAFVQVLRVHMERGPC